MSEVGNHALCGCIARILEDQKIDGKVSPEKKEQLIAYCRELDSRLEPIINPPVLLAQPG